MTSTVPFGIEVLYQELPFMSMDLEDTLHISFYQSQEDLARVINNNIRMLTPVDTGALLRSEKYDVNENPGDDTLIRFYADSETQIEQWKRVYVSYQEGAPLGQSTYTNEAHQMYYSQATYESIDQLHDWGYGRMSQAVNSYVLEFSRT